ncbi:MAG: hypothetical protein ACLFTH_03050 [Candidatus Woesearchaeota archaeon]
MDQKGQITIIAILGLVILIGVGIYFAFMTASSTDSLENMEKGAIETEGKTVDQIMGQAVSACARPALHNISKQAVRTRFFTTDSGSLSSGGVPYFYFAGRSLFPSRAEVQTVMASEMEDPLWKCVNSTIHGLDRLPGSLTFEDDPLDVEVTISESELVAVTSLDGFYTSQDSRKRLKPVREAIDSVVGVYYGGIEMMLYPPELEGSEYFFSPSFGYFDEHGISADAYAVPDSDLLFVLEKSEPADDGYSFEMTFRFHGVSS